MSLKIAKIKVKIKVRKSFFKFFVCIFIYIKKDTGEKKQIERKEEISSFFNFFTNLKTPTEEEIKNVNFDIEKELGSHLDIEYELGVELTEEIIPYASQFFAGVSHDEEEYHEYAMEQREKKFE